MNSLRSVLKNLSQISDYVLTEVLDHDHEIYWARRAKKENRTMLYDPNNPPTPWLNWVYNSIIFCFVYFVRKPYIPNFVKVYMNLYRYSNQSFSCNFYRNLIVSLCLSISFFIVLQRNAINSMNQTSFKVFHLVLHFRNKTTGIIHLNTKP